MRVGAHRLTDEGDHVQHRPSPNRVHQQLVLSILHEAHHGWQLAVHEERVVDRPQVFRGDEHPVRGLARHHGVDRLAAEHERPGARVDPVRTDDDVGVEGLPGSCRDTAGLCVLNSSSQRKDKVW
jgi:hypothetical protein